MKKKSQADTKAKGIFIVKNDRGLHTRPSTEIVRCATAFRSEITLTYKKIDVNARSILGILMLAAEKGSRIKITAEGNDATEAVDALLELASKSFNMNY